MGLSTGGPISWRNWKAKLADAPALGTVELRLYSDAWFIAEAQNIGPYSFLNPVPDYGSGGMYSLNPAIILRVQDHLPYEPNDLSATHDDNYHGGWLTDEIAALCCVILDARIVPGPIDREFEPDGDPFGRARTHTADLLPVLPQSSQRPQIPRLLGQRDLRDLSRLERYPHLDTKTARALVKSCRMYQQALWIADSSPQMAWLLLVSAVEAVALEWDQVRMSPLQRLELSNPELMQILRNNSDPELCEIVAIKLQHLIAATSKFISFVTEFAPNAPMTRPKFSQFDFCKAALKRTMGQVYGYRSRALHAGTPFPDPMCWPPNNYGGDEPEEIPSGLAAGARGSSWLAKDTPLLLHTFAYITRGALLNWWDSITPAPASDAASV